MVPGLSLRSPTTLSNNDVRQEWCRRSGRKDISAPAAGHDQRGIAARAAERRHFVFQHIVLRVCSDLRAGAGQAAPHTVI
jgi:hypothetical protein